MSRFVKVFFEEERLPIAEGWKPRTVQITNETLTPIQATIKQFSEWTADEGVASSVTFILSGNHTFVVYNRMQFLFAL
jgi:hypothetical protein